MLLFTNQFTYDLILGKTNDVIFKARSFANEKFSTNFGHQYIKAINLYLGVKKALEMSELINSKKNRFLSFSKRRKNCSAKLYNDG